MIAFKFPHILNCLKIIVILCEHLTVNACFSNPWMWLYDCINMYDFSPLLTSRFVKIPSPRIDIPDSDPCWFIKILVRIIWQIVLTTQCIETEVTSTYRGWTAIRYWCSRLTLMARHFDTSANVYTSSICKITNCL